MKEVKAKNKESKVFTFEVKMVVSVFESDEKTAQDKLDREGGFVSKRDVVLLEQKPLIS